VTSQVCMGRSLWALKKWTAKPPKARILAGFAGRGQNLSHPWVLGFSRLYRRALVREIGQTAHVYNRRRAPH